VDFDIMLLHVVDEQVAVGALVMEFHIVMVQISARFEIQVTLVAEIVVRGVTEVRLKRRRGDEEPFAVFAPFASMNARTPAMSEQAVVRVEIPLTRVAVKGAVVLVHKDLVVSRHSCAFTWLYLHEWRR
jgi:hypothetical protein